MQPFLLQGKDTQEDCSHQIPNDLLNLCLSQLHFFRGSLQRDLLIAICEFDVNLKETSNKNLINTLFWDKRSHRIPVKRGPLGTWEGGGEEDGGGALRRTLFLQ